MNDERQNLRQALIKSLMESHNKGVSGVAGVSDVKGRVRRVY